MKLSFRKKGIPSFVKRRILMLLAVFIVSFAGFVILLNLEKDILSGGKVQTPSLPTLSIISSNETYGEFFAYKNPIDLGRIRNGLVPLTEKREVEFVLDTYGSSIESLSYEISTGDGERKIAGNTIESFNTEAGKVQAAVSLSNLVEEGREYMLTFRADTNKDSLYYYMRIKYVEKGDIEECLEFSRYFMETALSSNFVELATYMEPRRTQRNGISTVTINSSLNDVGWQGFSVESYTPAKAYFAEIDDSYTALTLRYFVTGDKLENPGTFMVDEYYRMRHGEERIYLLDFERKLTQLFTNESIRIQDSSLLLGQIAEEPEFLSNRTGTNVAFVWGGDAYEYSTTTNVLSRVFHFGQILPEDPRTTHDEHDIKLLSIDENGNISYVVYGYMNSGEHEGMCGIGLYHYDPIEDHSTEQAFMVTDHPFTSLKAGFDGGVYLSSSGLLYVDLEGEFICCNINDGSVEKLISITEGYAYAMSKEGRYLAYADDSRQEIVVRDLFTEKESVIPSPEGYRIDVCGFMFEDLVYGIINELDFVNAGANGMEYPLESLAVANVSEDFGQVLKSYSKPGMLVTNIGKESDYIMSFSLSVRSADNYIDVNKDSIQSTGSFGELIATLGDVSEGTKSIISIDFSKSLDLSAPSVTIRDFDELNLTKSYALDCYHHLNPDNIVYYAYKGLSVEKSARKPADGIHSAYAAMGYMVDNDGNYIWQYGRGSNRKSIDWERLMDNPQKERLDLQGCELEEVLSYVYRDNVVFVNETTENPLIITGFNENSIVIYQMSNREEIRLLKEETTNHPFFAGKRYSVYRT